MDKITIRHICIGAKFTQPYVQGTFEITDIIEDPHAGEPCYDMWGGEVWSKPKYSVCYKNLETGKTGGFAVQTDKSDLRWIISTLKLS